MRLIRNFIALSLAFFAFSSVETSAQNFSGRGGQSARSIEQQVFKKINGLPYYGVFDHIAFEVKGDQVVLYGKVASLGTRKSAERAVAKIPGVRSVVNNITNLPPSSFDNQIRRSILRSFSDSAGLYGYLREPSPSVRIIVENGRVALEGYVNNRGTANVMNILANGTPGVFRVQNNLRVTNDRGR